MIEDSSFDTESSCANKSSDVMQQVTTLLKHVAIDLLSRREYAIKELQDKLIEAGLKRRQFSEFSLTRERLLDLASTLVLELAELGYVNNQRFIESFVRSRVARGQGLVRIKYELKHKGVSDGEVEAVLEAQETDWFALAVELRCRRFSNDLPDNPKERARQLRFLQQRGFSTEQCFHALSYIPEDDNFD